MLIAQWNILNRASDGWEAKGAVLADALVRRGVDAVDWLQCIRQSDEGRMT